MDDGKAANRGYPNMAAESPTTATPARLGRLGMTIRRMARSGCRANTDAGA